MRDTDDVQLVVPDAKHGVVSEFNAADITEQGGIRQGQAKSQVPIFTVQRQEMARQRRPVKAREFTDMDGHG